MNVYGELTSAQLENLAADPTLATLRKGRLWFRTDLSSLKVDLGGSAETLAMLAATQTFSGKSFSDAVTMAQISSPTAPSSGFTKLYTKSDGTMYQLPNGGSENQVGSQMSAGTLYKQIATPSTPSSGFQYFYPKSDGNFYTKLPSGVELPVGTASSGSKNYLTSYRGNPGNGNFELGSTTGWSLFTTTLTGVIPTGTISAGAASITTFAATAVQPLAGTYSLEVDATTAWAAGQGFISDGFSLDDEDLGKMMQVTAYFKVRIGAAACNFSGTSANTFAVYLWDSINSAWVQPAGTYSMSQNSGAGVIRATFQTGISSTQYRLAIICINAAGAPVGMTFDDFFVGPQIAPMGPAMTDAKAFTPTLSAGFGSPTNVTCFYRQVGDCCEMWGTFTTGTVAGSVARISLPSGISVDTSKIDRVSGQIVGWSSATNSTTTGIPNNALLFIANTQTQNLSVTNMALNPSSNNLTETNVNLSFNSSTPISFFARFPVAGWSSNCVMSSDTDSRVVALIANSPNSTITGTTSDITWATTVKDTHGTFNGTTYTIPVSGLYLISCGFRVSGSYTANQYAEVNVTQNGTTKFDTVPRTFSGAAEAAPILSGLLDCKAGDLIKLQINAQGSTLAFNGGSIYNWFQLFRLSGPAVVAATETVACRYELPATSSLLNGGVVVPFSAKIYDTHGVMSAGTFTCPVSGFYKVSAHIVTNPFASGAVTRQCIAFVRKNATNYGLLDIQSVKTTTSVIQTLSGSVDVQANAGDTLDVYWTSDDGSIVSNSAQNYSHIEISRIR
jgi:hypothetical protein